MSIPAASRLGPYEIKSTLGVGGMGEVYRARDTRLNRDVAVKVLRQDVTAGPDQRARFEREAHALAALNHPNIVVVHDFGIEDGQPYIVSELVEGESLRALLDGKPTAARKLVDIAVQIADALAAAHAAGIVHRDLKPENIMLGKDGRVKILDFGLARQTAPIGSDETLELTQHRTREGAVVGTASYMSPEQALGKPVDYRSDQFSFGLILYELASGKQPFSRPSSVETMAAIVREDPPPIDEKIPAPLRWIIDRCLAKEPEQRCESTRDLYRDLRSLRDHFSEAISSGSSPSGVGLTPVAAAPTRRRWTLFAAFAAACFVAAFAAWLLKPSGPDLSNYRFTPFASNAQDAIWSPDGKAVAYDTHAGDTWQVFVRYLNSPGPVEITHALHIIQPLGWSADRNHLLVIVAGDSGDSLASVPIIGGDPDPLLANIPCRTCAVSPDGQSFATLVEPSGAGQLNGIGISHPIGAPLQLYQPAPFASHELLFNNPALAFSPDGKKILFFRAGDANREEWWILPLPAGSASPHRVLTYLHDFSGNQSFSWLPDSRHIVVNLQMVKDSPNHLWIADTESDDLEPLTADTEDERAPAVSPDGQSLIYRLRSSSYQIVSVPLADGAARTLVSTGREESMAAWAANDDLLAWVTNRNGPYEVWVRTSAGSERPVVTAASFSDGKNRWFMNPTPSPDGQKLIFARIDKDSLAFLWITSLAGGSPVRLTNAESGAEAGGSWSPDGSRFVYLQETRASSLMMVRTSGDAHPVTLRANVVDSLPAWSPDGNWIAFRDEKGWNLMTPDGKTSRFLGNFPTQSLAFSKDGRLLYGIDAAASASLLSPSDEGDRAILFSIDLATLQRRTIRDLGPNLIARSLFDPGIRFTLTPDGNSLTWVTGNLRGDLWMLQGFRQPRWFSRF